MKAANCIGSLIPEDFSGAVSIVQGGQAVFQKAFGYADRANSRTNRLDTRFPTASAGKAFVAAAILHLIEKGCLHPDDCIGNLLPFDLKSINRKVTLSQLLSHTSGVPDYFDETVMTVYSDLWRDFPNYKIRSSMDLVPLFIDKPMMYSPGERFQYNNTGYVLLGLVIESVTGMPFDQYLFQTLFAPAGMARTGYYELDRLPVNCANAYIHDDHTGEYYINIFSVDCKGTGAGGAYTTVLDIDRFWEMLLQGRLLSEKMVSCMISPHATEEGTYYGYGLWLHKKKSGDYLPYFQGSDPGVSFLSSYDLQKQLSVTLVSNMEQNVWELERAIRTALDSMEL